MRINPDILSNVALKNFIQPALRAARHRVVRPIGRTSPACIVITGVGLTATAASLFALRNRTYTAEADFHHPHQHDARPSPKPSSSAPGRWTRAADWRRPAPQTWAHAAVDDAEFGAGREVAFLAGEEERRAAATFVQFRRNPPDWIRRVSVVRTSSDAGANNGVSVGPGLTTLTRMPRGASSFAKVRGEVERTAAPGSRCRQRDTSSVPMSSAMEPTRTTVSWACIIATTRLVANIRERTSRPKVVEMGLLQELYVGVQHLQVREQLDWSSGRPEVSSTQVSSPQRPEGSDSC